MTAREILNNAERITEEIDRNYFSAAAVAAHRISYWSNPVSDGLLSEKEREDTLRWWKDRYHQTVHAARQSGLYIVWVPEDTENLL